MRTHLSTLLILVALPFTIQSQPAAAQQAPTLDGLEVQTRGPVHEGYAQPTDAAAQPLPAVPKEPPPPIAEQPPDQKPEGDNVQWIPGYWAWDADKNDYIWVSGFWRVPPPHRKWVPGHWADAAG